MTFVALTNVTSDINWFWLDIGWYFFLLLMLLTNHFKTFTLTRWTFCSVDMASIFCFLFRIRCSFMTIWSSTLVRFYLNYF